MSLNTASPQRFYSGASTGIKAPQMTTGYYVVPDYSTPGYSTLTHGTAPSTGVGYFQIDRAYGAGSANCTTNYVAMQC